MTPYSAGTRWWENYLVRYFMPSIAGVIAVSWLVALGGTDLRLLLRLPPATVELETPGLILLFLYGNLFCYVASYPILAFHATRVLDFGGKEVRWHWGLPNLDGYVATIILAGAVLFTSLTISGVILYWSAFAFAALFAALQLARLWRALRPRHEVAGLGTKANPMFALAHALAMRRSLRQVTHLEEGVLPAEAESAVGATERSEAASTRGVGPGVEDAASRSVGKVIEWRPEFMETYRHMREHGNSAYIFVLELVLAGLVYCIVSLPGQSASEQLTAIGVLFGLWALPAVFVHLAGQQLERRFSKLDDRW
jgi:hypothetical protein